MRSVLSISLVLCAACVGDDGGGDDSGVGGTLPAADESTLPTVVPTTRSSDLDPGLCLLLPQDDSACAHVCDLGGVTPYVPAGTCAVFDCPLSDGTIYRTGGCNL